MPERVATRNPTILAGTNVSGTLGPNTGQICMTFGGQRSFQKLSGTAGGAATIWTGAGRLDSLIIHPPAARTVAVGADVNSGLRLILYDGTCLGSGGPLSGELQLFAGFSNTGNGGVEATVSGGFRCGNVFQLGHPFLSGLSHNSTSGQDGFTCFFTPVVSGATSPG